MLISSSFGSVVKAAANYTSTELSIFDAILHSGVKAACGVYTGVWLRTNMKQLF